MIMTKKKVIIIFTAFMAFMIMINSISASEVKEINNLNETTTDEIKVPATFHTLQSELIHAKNNLTLDKDYAFNNNTDFRHVKGLYLNGRFVLDGQGHNIDAKGQSRIFLINSANVTIKKPPFG